MKNQEENNDLHISHEEHNALLEENERLRAELDAQRAAHRELQEEYHGDVLAVQQNPLAADMDERVAIATQALNDIQWKLNNALLIIANNGLDALTMTDAQRRRLLGAGVRRYGFIEKVSEVSAESPQFFPTFLTQPELNEMNLQIGIIRNIMAATNQISRIMTDHYLLTSDEGFRMARLYYTSVRQAARNGVAGALPIFNLLRLLFRRSSISSDPNPTQHEVLTDVKGLLHGTKDGRIVIENERPKVVAGKHVVVDEMHRDKDAFKVSESGEI